jgi:hypothetical protein
MLWLKGKAEELIFVLITGLGAVLCRRWMTGSFKVEGLDGFLLTVIINQ